MANSKLDDLHDISGQLAAVASWVTELRRRLTIDHDALGAQDLANAGVAVARVLKQVEDLCKSSTN